jgi:hypothetical protein
MATFDASNSLSRKRNIKHLVRADVVAKLEQFDFKSLGIDRRKRRISLSNAASGAHPSASPTVASGSSPAETFQKPVNPFPACKTHRTAFKFTASVQRRENHCLALVLYNPNLHRRRNNRRSEHVLLGDCWKQLQKAKWLTAGALLSDYGSIVEDDGVRRSKRLANRPLLKYH